MHIIARKTCEEFNKGELRKREDTDYGIKTPKYINCLLRTKLILSNTEIQEEK